MSRHISIKSEGAWATVTIETRGAAMMNSRNDDLKHPELKR
jgi:hypothetical protein